MIEMMMVVAIIGVLTAIAAPSFKQTIEMQRAKSAAADLHAALTRTRSEAIKRNTDVTLSPKSGNWGNGWQLADPGSSVVIDDHGSITGLTLSGPSSIVYRRSGRISWSENVAFSITGTYSTTVRYICIDLSGRPAVQTAACPS